MIDLYYWPTPNGDKVTIMLEECDLPYRIIPVHIGRGDQFLADFLSISPNNKIPAIVDHDAEDGIVSLFESGAILEYLADKTRRYLPTGGRARYETLQWLYWQMAGLGPMMGQVHHFLRYAPEITELDLTYGADRYFNEGHRLMRIMDQQLAHHEYLAGAYSIADIASWPWVQKREKVGYDMSCFPNLQRWITDIGERPAVQRALAQANCIREKYPASGTLLDEKARKILFGQK